VDRLSKAYLFEFRALGSLEATTVNLLYVPISLCSHETIIIENETEVTWVLIFVHEWRELPYVRSSTLAPNLRHPSRLSVQVKFINNNNLVRDRPLQVGKGRNHFFSERHDLSVYAFIKSRSRIPIGSERSNNAI